MPPAASIADAAMMTARMISSTSTGGDVGVTPKTTISTSSPTPPHRPRPTPENRAPIQIAASTTTNCRTIEPVMAPLASSARGASDYCSNFGLIRFSNENTSSHFSCVEELPLLDDDVVQRLAGLVALARDLARTACSRAKA